MFIVKLENPLHLRGSTKPTVSGQCCHLLIKYLHYWGVSSGVSALIYFRNGNKRDWRTTVRNLTLESLKRCLYEFSKLLQGLSMFSRGSQWIFQCLVRDNLCWGVTALAEIMLKMCQYYRRSWKRDSQQIYALQYHLDFLEMRNSVSELLHGMGRWNHGNWAQWRLGIQQNSWEYFLYRRMSDLYSRATAWLKPSCQLVKKEAGNV